MSFEALAVKQCVACKGGVPPLKGAALQSLYKQLNHDWRLVGEHHLEKDFKFSSYKEVVDFTNRVAKLAVEQNHHPEIQLGWGHTKVQIWTHKIEGLTESDFIFAAKTEALI